MTMDFTEIEITSIRDNAFQAIGKDWMLVTAGPIDAFNTMTANWGAWGELWARRVSICFVRPQRHTYGFMNQAEFYTLSHFDQAHHAALDYLGTHSGKNEDKVAAVKLSPVSTPSGAVTFAEARLVLECRKLYAGDLQADAFVDKSIPSEVYASGDYHRMYVGEIVRAWTR